MVETGGHLAQTNVSAEALYQYQYWSLPNTEGASEQAGIDYEGSANYHVGFRMVVE